MTNCWFRFFCKAPWRYITTSFAVTLPAQVFKFWNLRHLSKYVHYMLSITRRSHSRREEAKISTLHPKSQTYFTFCPALNFLNCKFHHQDARKLICWLNPDKRWYLAPFQSLSSTMTNNCKVPCMPWRFFCDVTWSWLHMTFLQNQMKSTFFAVNTKSIFVCRKIVN